MKRLYFMDYLNVLATFAVVCLHCTTAVFLNTGDLAWVLDVIVQSVCCAAVPLFFLVSGANLIGYRERYSTKTFFVRRMRRVLSVLISASLLIYLLSCFDFAPAVGMVQRSFSIKEFFELLFTNQINDIFWFLYCIIGLYLMTPIISRIAVNRDTLRYAIVLSFVMSTAFPLVARLLQNDNIMSVIRIDYVYDETGALFYYLSGYYIVRYIHIRKKMAYVMPAILAPMVMIILTLICNAPYTVQLGNYRPFDNFFIGTSSALCVVYSLSLFVLFSSWEEKLKNCPLSSCIVLLSSCSFGIYALHIPIINALDVYIPHRIMWDIVMRPFVVYFASLIIVMIYRLARKLLLEWRASS